MGRGWPKKWYEITRTKNGTSRPGRDVLVREGGPEVGLAGQLLLPHGPTHPLNLLDLLFYNIKYFNVPNICILTSGLQVTSKRTKLYSAFWRENSWNHYGNSQLLSNTVQNQRVRSDFYLRQARLPLVTNGGPVAIGTDRYHILQRVGGHWSPLIQLATDVGSPNSDFKASSKFWFRICSRLFPFGPGKYKYPNTASAQSDQRLRCALNGWLRNQAYFTRTAKTLFRLGGCPGWSAKTLIRLDGCPGWSESSLGAYSFCWFCHVAAH